MSYYITDFSKIRQEKSLIPLLEALERGFVKFGIDYYLIGALARDVWMRGVYDIVPKRATSDIDFGIWIKDTAQYDALKNYLVEMEGFSASEENVFALKSKEGREIDILPFGVFENEGKLAVKGIGLTHVRLDGLREVYEGGSDDVTVENKITFKVCTLPGIVVLKFIAWDDRPEIRFDDLKDIAEILLHFFNIYDEVIWEQHSDLFDRDSDLLIISARVLGRDMGNILQRNIQLLERVLNLFPAANAEKSNFIALGMAEVLNKTVEETIEIMAEMEKGVLDLNPDIKKITSGI